MRLTGIWKQREVLDEVGPFDSIDEWLKRRMCQRTVLECRQVFFEVVNQQIDRIRRAGEQAQQAQIEQPPKRRPKGDRQSAS